MCLLTFIDKNQELPYENARNGAIQNPDGFGFAIHADSKIVMDKDMDFQKLWARWEKAREVHRGYALWHFRIGTHGAQSLDNCHPFVLDDEQTVVAHNGILPITLPYKDSRSDTNIFANVVMPRLGGVQYLNDKDNCDALEKWACTNKLVFLSADPRSEWSYYIVNMDLGHWDAGVWYSNRSYVPFTYRSWAPGPYRTPYLGWDDDDDYYDGYGHFSGRTGQVSAVADETNSIQEELNDENEVIDLMEELYEESSKDWVSKILTFTSLDGYHPALVECAECGSITLADPLEPSPTHCGACNACLACGSSELCECWTGYPYHQAFTEDVRKPSFVDSKGNWV